jgi:Zn-dependent protease
MDSNSIIQKIVLYAIPLILAITIHEASHAYMANRHGDNTAKLLGRLSLNPLHHIDMIGTVLFPLIGLMLGGFIFGWAKPIPVNYVKLYNPKKDIFWVALSGPASNLTMALLWALILKSATYLPIYFASFLILMAQFGIYINIVIMVLNLLPILPLDGGRMLFSLLPHHQAQMYSRIEPYGMWILLLILLFGGFAILHPIISQITNLIMFLIR